MAPDLGVEIWTGVLIHSHHPFLPTSVAGFEWRRQAAPAGLLLHVVASLHQYVHTVSLHCDSLPLSAADRWFFLGSLCSVCVCVCVTFLLLPACPALGGEGEVLGYKHTRCHSVQHAAPLAVPTVSSLPPLKG